MSLRRLADELSLLGHHEDALKALKEEVALFRERERAGVEVATYHLAGSSMRLAASLSDLGRHEEAVDAALEGIDRYRVFAGPWRMDDPELGKPAGVVLAGWLDVVADWLFALGRGDEALEAEEEAVELYRELARAKPGTFDRELATSLNAPANMLSKLGRNADSLARAQEARDLCPDFSQTSRSAASLSGLLGALSSKLRSFFDIKSRRKWHS